MTLSATEMVSPFQIGWYIEPEPALLPIWLIALGLEAMFIAGTHQALDNVSGYQDLTRLERAIAAGGVAFGYLFLTLSVLRTNYGWYAGFLYLVFRGVEGVAAIHMYAKVYNFLRGKGFGGSYTARAKHMLAVFFVLALGLYLTIKALVGSSRIGGVWYNLSMVYTGVVAVVSVLAVRWRYRDIAREVPNGVVGGLALCIAGAQIFGFTLAGDIVLSIAGSVVYSIGFWVAAYLLWGEIITDAVQSSPSTCTHCQQSLPTDHQPQYCPHCGNQV